MILMEPVVFNVCSDENVTTRELIVTNIFFTDIFFANIFFFDYKKIYSELQHITIKIK